MFEIKDLMERLESGETNISFIVTDNDYEEFELELKKFSERLIKKAKKIGFETKIDVLGAIRLSFNGEEEYITLNDKLKRNYYFGEEPSITFRNKLKALGFNITISEKPIEVEDWEDEEDDEDCF